MSRISWASRSAFFRSSASVSARTLCAAGQIHENRQSNHIAELHECSPFRSHTSSHPRARFTDNTEYAHRLQAGQVHSLRVVLQQPHGRCFVAFVQSQSRFFDRLLQGDGVLLDPLLLRL